VAAFTSSSKNPTWPTRAAEVAVEAVEGREAGVEQVVVEVARW
jgi:hypothetical protein